MRYELRQPVDNSKSIMQQILNTRGIEDCTHYLNTTDNDICDPLLLNNMEAGAKVLLKHIKNNSNILVIVDCDADGYTSAATLINFLHRLFPSFVYNHISYKLHDGKQHGILSSDAIPDTINLVIAPDASSNEYEIHQQLSERGIDVLILDHHHADRESEYACVINNQLCDYPTKSLSGVGVVYKFCQYLDSVAGTAYADDYLDLVACGMVADMSSLRDYETKHLIQKGLKNMKNPFLYTMSKKNAFSLGDTITPIGVAFYIAPYINATVRSGTIKEKLTLFESMVEYLGYEEIPSTKRGCSGQLETRAEQACRNCANVKNRQTKATDACLNVIEQKIKDYNLLENQVLLVTFSKEEEAERNILGLMANKLAAKYQKPTLILKENEEGSYVGSARGLNNSELVDFRQFLESYSNTEFATGHANACGTSLPVDSLEDFIKFSNNELSDYNFSPCYKVDFILNNDTLDPNTILTIGKYESIWGQEVEEPLIAIENLQISKDNLTLLSRDRNPTLKITLNNGISLIRFKSSEQEYESLFSDLGCVTINVVGTCQINRWNGKEFPQIKIEDYEIINRQNYYF